MTTPVEEPRLYPRAEMDPTWTPTQQLAFAELLRRDYGLFVRYFWSTVEPRPLQWNWHIGVICDHLQQLHQGTLGSNKLYIAIPPGCMKSSLTSVFYDAWRWLDEPGYKCLVASHDQALVVRDNVKCRRVVESDAYKHVRHLLGALGKEPWQLAPDQNQKQYFENTKNGFRQCTTVRAGGTGKRGDTTVVDDPHKIVELIHASASRQTEILEETWQWFTDVFSSRLNDLPTGKQVVIMQRVHEEDIVGHLEKDPTWHGLVLPMRYDPDIADPDDPRTEPGQLLFPAKFPEDVVQSQMRTMTPGQASAQYGQRPIPTKGGLVKVEWCQRRYQHQLGDWRQNPHLPQMRRTLVSFDCANKARKLNDPTVAMLLGEDSEGTIYLLDLQLQRFEYADLETHAPRWIDSWRPDHILVEDAANGTALWSKLNRLGYRAIPILPHQDKHVRMSNQTPWLAGGRFVFPSDGCPWLPHLLLELLKFPQVKHDDQVDALSQGLAWFTDNPVRTASGYAFQTTDGRVIYASPAAAPQHPPEPPAAPAESSMAGQLAHAQLQDLRQQVARLLRA